MEMIEIQSDIMSEDDWGAVVAANAWSFENGETSLDALLDTIADAERHSGMMKAWA